MEIVADLIGIEKAIRLLKRQTANDGVLKELRNRRGYWKPSDKRRRKRGEARRRRAKEAAKMERLSVGKTLTSPSVSPRRTSTGNCGSTDRGRR